MSQIIPLSHVNIWQLIYEKTITGGIPKSWCDYSPEVTCGLHPHHISGVTIDSIFNRSSYNHTLGLGE